MVNRTISKKRFTGGEISPLLEQASDLEFHDIACRELKNMVSLVQGGAERRPGFEFIAEGGDMTSRIRLIPFRFSTVQAYVLEFGDGYIRFFKDDGIISGGATGATIANGDFDTSEPGGSWTASHTGTGAAAYDATNKRVNLTGDTLSNAGRIYQQVLTDNVQTAGHLSVRFRVVGRAGEYLRPEYGGPGTSFIGNGQAKVGYHVFNFDWSSGPPAEDVYLAFASIGNENGAKAIAIDDVVANAGGDSGVVLGSPYAASELSALKFVQSADLLYLYHPDHPTYRLVRRGHDEWSLEEVAWEDGPYLSENIEATTLTPSANSGNGVTITASLVTGINDDTGFQASDVGRPVRLLHGSTWGYGVITGVTSTTVCTVDVLSNFGGTGAVTAWRLGLWSSDDDLGYSRAGFFYEERNFVGGAAGNTDRLDASKGLFDIENYAPGTEADDPLSNVVASNEVSSILWFTGGSRLYVGTLGAVYEIRPTSTDGILKPGGVRPVLAAKERCADIAPLLVSDTVALFVGEDTSKLFELVFELANETYVAPDLTERADHLTAAGIAEMAWQKYPYNVIWCALEDGGLVGLTYLRRQDVVAWHPHPVGGAFDGGAAVIESVASVPGTNGRDRIWAVVKRTIDGNTVRYIERLGAWRNPHTAALEDLPYMDSYIEYDGSPATSFTGADHLEGEDVAVLADGVVIAGVTVSGGGFTLAEAASKVFAGLANSARLSPTRPDPGSPDGSGAGKIGRIVDVHVDVYRSGSYKIGPDDSLLDDVTHATLSSGYDTQAFPGESERERDVLIVSDDPLPLMVRGITMEVEVE